MRLDPQTPEFQAVRKSWWMFLAAAIVLVLTSLGARYFDRSGIFLHAQVTLGSMTLTWGALISSITLGLGYACLFYGLYLDFTKIRPMRLAHTQAERSAEKTAKPSKKDSSKT